MADPKGRPPIAEHCLEKGRATAEPLLDMGRFAVVGLCVPLVIGLVMGPLEDAGLPMLIWNER